MTPVAGTVVPSWRRPDRVPTASPAGSSEALEPPVPPVVSGRRRTDRFLRFALAALRTLNLAVGALVILTRIAQYTRPLLVVAVLAEVRRHGRAGCSPGPPGRRW